MRVVLWLASLVTVVFLSLWPFTFAPDLATEAAWRALAGSWGWSTSRGDAAGNLALFVPVGLLGMIAVRPLPRLAGVALVATVALLVAAGVQAAQVVIPDRTATLVDVAWNLVGLLPGLVLGLVPWEARLVGLGFDRRLRPLPWLILAAWIAYRLVPLVPSLDLQLIKNNLKPLLLDPVLDVPNLTNSAVAWLTAGYLMRAGDTEGRLDRLLPILIALVLAGEVLIVGRDGVSASNVLGALVGLGLWFAIARRVARPAGPVVALLALAITINALWPFAFDWSAGSAFNWVPFAGILGGSMWHNLLAITQKVYFYTAAGFVLRDLVGSWRWSAALAGTWLLALEQLQRYQPGHVPEITDPVLVLLACLTGAALAPVQAPPSGARSWPRFWPRSWPRF